MTANNASADSNRSITEVYITSVEACSRQTKSYKPTPLSLTHDYQLYCCVLGTLAVKKRAWPFNCSLIYRVPQDKQQQNVMVINIGITLMYESKCQRQPSKRLCVAKGLPNAHFLNKKSIVVLIVFSIVQTTKAFHNQCEICII